MPEKRLKKGFTTGSAASAGVKAALITLLTGAPPETVEICFLSGGNRTVRVHRLERISDTCCEAFVIKDAGDDPDITHKAEIGARVILAGGPPEEIVILGGQGVGRVTKPGLEIEVGHPAINPGPLKMIRQAVRDVYEQTAKPCQHQVTVEVIVPRGEELAKKTLNARLGILGGISILGTTGIVRPLSHDAYIATIKSAISVAAARGISTLVFTTGRRSERFAMDLFRQFPEEAFIQTGDFFKAAIDAARSAGIKEIIYTVFFGKAVKMAMGFEHTHAAKSELTLKTLADWALDITGNPTLAQNIARANTARHAFTYIHPQYSALMVRVGQGICQSARKFARENIRFKSVIFDFDGNIAFKTTN